MDFKPHQRRKEIMGFGEPRWLIHSLPCTNSPVIHPQRPPPRPSLPVCPPCSACLTFLLLKCTCVSAPSPAPLLPSYLLSSGGGGGDEAPPARPPAPLRERRGAAHLRFSFRIDRPPPLTPGVTHVWQGGVCGGVGGGCYIKSKQFLGGGWSHYSGGNNLFDTRLR